MAFDIDQANSMTCRTCGIWYLSATNYLKPLFSSAVDYPEMMPIRMELAQWKIELNEGDGLPQNVCITCIHEFQKFFSFREAAIDQQEQFRSFYKMREVNLANIKIKTEKIDPNEESEPRCDFIYIDDFSDDGDEYESVTPFNIPHVPIKEEPIEQATVPQEDDQSKPNCMAESASAGGIGAIASMPHATTPPQQQYSQDFTMPSAAAGPADFVMEEAQISEPQACTVECELCQYISPDLEEHKNHMRRVHENRDMECHICGKIFQNSTQSRFKFHLKWHNINKHVKCPQCGFVCSSRQGLKEHQRAMHTKINCKICGKGVLAKKMKGHLRKHEIAQFPCEYCTEVLKSEQEREAHIWQTHANDNSQENTNLENSVPKDDVEGDIEQEEHDSTYDQPIVSVEIMCAQCDEKFLHPADLELHVQLVHFKKEQQFVNENCEESIGQEVQNIAAEPISNSGLILMPKEEQMAIYDEQDTEGHKQTSVDKNDIEVFQDYDNEEADNEVYQPTEECNNAISNTEVPFLTQTHANTDTDNCQDDYDNPVSVEHLAENNKVQNSDTESETENYSESKYMPRSIPQYSCAKCTDTFSTIDALREHYKQHQQPQNEASPTKSKFNCHICEKQFALKFSLNRHIRKHKSEKST